MTAHERYPAGETGDDKRVLIAPFLERLGEREISHRRLEHVALP